MTHIDNKVLKVLFLVVTFTLVGAGCYRSVRTSTGHGSSSPVHSEWNSEEATTTCGGIRQAQDNETTTEAFALLRRVGLMPTTSTVSAEFHNSTVLLCRHSDGRERDGQPRLISRADCERLLAPGAMQPGQPERLAVTERVSDIDPRVQEMILPIARARLIFALFMADAQNYCQNREDSNPVFMNGSPVPGFVEDYPTGASYGRSVFGNGGLGSSVFGGTMGGYATAGGSFRSVPYEVSSSTNFQIGITMMAITPGMGVAAAPMGGFTLEPFQSQLVNLPSTNQVQFRVVCSNGGTFTRTYFPGHSLGWSGVTDQECTSAPGAVFLH